MSFRLKTILGIAIIQAVLLIVLVVNSLSLLRASNENELMTRLYTTAQLFATTTKEAVLTTDLAALDSFVDEVLTNRDLIYARVVDHNGRILAQGGDPAALARPFVADHSVGGMADSALDAYADIEVAGVKYGRVEIGMSSEQVEALMATARGRTVTIAVVGMLFVTVFSAMLGVYLARRLGALRTAAQRIAEGEFGYEINVSGRDELAQTATAFNDMSRKLAAMDHERRIAQEAIVKLNEDLERQVASRTQELAEANQELAHQALHDALTQIPNRVLFIDRLEQAMSVARREQRRVALAMVDVDNFKEINDGAGHHLGDKVLQAVAQRLKQVLRGSDTVARLGGDEFAAVLTGIESEGAARAIAKKISGALKEPLIVDAQTMRIAGSLGIAIYPDHGQDVDLLMRRADAAMYAAKRGKTVYEVYSPDLDVVAAERLALQSELRTAIDRDELVLYYQPKVDLRANRTIGVEALARWHHPTRGFLYPDQFIPIAEQSGLIKPFTEWALRQALVQVKVWHDRGLNLTVAVNISAASLQDPEFPNATSAALEALSVPTQWLELEVTETAIMLDPARASETLRDLGNIGIRLSIDDFGTGYSSMAYLRNLPMAQVKIDKSFVMEMQDNANDHIIVRSIIGLGHSLGLEVVAEGVEDPESLRELKALGCDIAQGFLISPPVPAEELEKWLAVSPWGGTPQQDSG